SSPCLLDDARPFGPGGGDVVGEGWALAVDDLVEVAREAVEARVAERSADLVRPQGGTERQDASAAEPQQSRAEPEAHGRLEIAEPLRPLGCSLQLAGILGPGGRALSGAALAPHPAAC